MASVAQKKLSVKVLIISGSYPPLKCGVGDYSHCLAKALATIQSVSVGVLTSSVGVKEGSENGIEIFPVIKVWHLTEAPNVIRVIRSWSPDIIHIQYPTQGYSNGLLPNLLPIISFLMRKKTVQTWHDGYRMRDAPMLFLKAIVQGGLVVVRPRFTEFLNPMLRWALWNKKMKFIPNASTIPKSDLTRREKVLLRKRYLGKRSRLVVYFGFIYPHKGVELLFEIADPDSDHIVIAGELNERSDCNHQIMKNVRNRPWLGNVTIAGFLPATDIAALLAVADAVILPFRAGGGEWNTSTHGAVLQGTFVITTSKTKNGYDKKRNVYYAKLDDVEEMKVAFDLYAGRRREPSSDIDRDCWQQIAIEHHSLYSAILGVQSQ